MLGGDGGDGGLLLLRRSEKEPDAFMPHLQEILHESLRYSLKVSR